VTGSIGGLAVAGPLHSGRRKRGCNEQHYRTRRGEHAAESGTGEAGDRVLRSGKTDRERAIVAGRRFAFARKDDKPGFTVKLNTLPISGWNGAMVLVPPFADDDEVGRGITQDPVN